VLTAQSGGSEEKALDLGAQDYLTKPVQTRSLVARVCAVLKRINTRSRNYLSGDRQRRAPVARGPRRPSLACFLPLEQ